MNLDYIIGPRTNGANPFKIFSALEQSDPDAMAFALKRMHYSMFLKSSYWFAVSQVAKSRAGMRCQVCNENDRIEVHHRTYDTHGKEHLNMIDLVVLCWNCHGLFHGHVAAVRPKQRLTDFREPRVRLKQHTVIPHSEDEVKMPDGDQIVLTPDLINACRANGSFTNATLRAFGLKKPLISGWGGRLVGTVMSREKYRQALEGKFIYRSGPLERF